MIYSMTGFGSAEAESKVYRVKVEVKTLNSKFLDFIQKLPRELADKELEIKNMVAQKLNRGKVNMTIELLPIHMQEPAVHINEMLFKRYFETYKRLADECNANDKDLFRLALHSPDVILPDDTNDELDWELIRTTVESALDKCNEFRAAEGASLQEKLISYIDAIKIGLEEVTARDPERIKSIRDRISNSLDEIREKTQVDQNRFEQELIYYIEKLDITEEKVRLGRHLEYFREVLNEGDQQGKKLGFISQEIGREINTIGAKANDAIIQRAVVQMKDELEKIKEQTMNVI